MTFEEAEQILSETTRSELRDHAFGDREVFWTKDGVEIAGGYFGGRTADVWIGKGVEGWEGPTGDFEGLEARKLSQLGTLGVVDRNDETGPEEYSEGTTMPGLMIEGVRKELTEQPN
jgi:hypothetical protein